MMHSPVSDEEAALQILSVFGRYNVTASGVLKRNQFMEVRDSDFMRGLNGAVEKSWVERHPKDRYRYILTQAGRDLLDAASANYAAVAPSVSAPVALQQST
jgi:hypothetical protein